MTSTLGLDDFAAFFRAVNHGFDPFPWQQRLAESVFRSGRWPDVLDLPTGSGKTGTIEIAIFLRAVRADQPRRIVFVVDRRVIVHQAAARARRIAGLLAAPTEPAVAAVAEALRGSAFDRNLDMPLVAAELRGGIPGDETWALRPDVATVVVSTVDQVGSRLLFRGYGVSRGMRPVHAGLLGNDALFLLDEVHLAQPFAQTLRALRRDYRGLGSLPDRWAVVELSATPIASPGERFELADEDRDHPVLRRRLASRKPVTMTEVKSHGVEIGRQLDAVASASVGQARAAGVKAHVFRVGVVVNRVATAVRIYQGLQHDGPALLLTGRMRPFDRDDVQDTLEQEWLLGRDRSQVAKPARYLVSTQTIEAGADLDLDALVTECAPLDALVQRFGRLDRDGWLSQAGTPAVATIIATDAQRLGKIDDPVYGPALAETWAWLRSCGGDLDFGLDQRPRPSLDQACRMAVAVSEPPVLLPTHLRAWVQTSPPPHADPDPDLWLHGIREGANVDVSVVWRGDLGELADWQSDEDALVDWVAACPPTAGEAMAVPIGAVRKWLSQESREKEPGDDGVSDVEGADSVSEDDRRSRRRSREGRLVVLWRADDGSRLGSADDLRPGDTVIVPSAYGGITGGTWDPRSTERVVDLGARSQRARRGRLVLRLVEQLLPGAGCPEPAPTDSGEVTTDDLDQVSVLAWLASAQLADWCLAHRAGEEAGLLDPTVLEAIAVLQADTMPSGWTVQRFDRPGESSALIVEGTWPAERSAGVETSETVDSEPDTSSFIGREVTLEQHLDDVSLWAGEMAAKCHLPQHIVDDLALAGRLHDLGKGDPRFQQILQSGQPVAGTLLAKSKSAATNRAGRRLAQRRAGYPNRCRHELLSAFLAAVTPQLQEQANDWDLVLHLVTSHHGHGRPGVPVAIDDRPVDVALTMHGVAMSARSDHMLHRIDSGLVERFWDVNDRYGPFGVAWLEAILRLADHRASAERQLGGRR